MDDVMHTHPSPYLGEQGPAAEEADAGVAVLPLLHKVRHGLELRELRGRKRGERPVVVVWFGVVLCEMYFMVVVVVCVVVHNRHYVPFPFPRVPPTSIENERGRQNLSARTLRPTGRRRTWC